MQSESLNSTFVAVEIMDVGTSNATVMDATVRFIENCQSVKSTKVFPVSATRAVIRVQYQCTLEELATDIENALDKRFSQRIVPASKQKTALLTVIQTKKSHPETGGSIDSKSTLAPISPEPVPEVATLPLVPRLTRYSGLIYSVIAFAFVYVLLLRRMIGAGAFPNATDSFAHLYRASFVAEQWRLGIPFPLWTPGWYLGTPLVQYYPPLVTVVLAPLTLIGGITFGYQAFTMLCFGVAAISVVILFRSRLGMPGALIAGIVYPLSPFILVAAFTGGALPTTLAIAIQPILLRVILDLVEKPSRRRFLLVVLMAAMAVLAHHLLAVMFFSSISSGIVLLAIVNKNRRQAAGIAIAAIAVGIGMTSMWLFSGQSSTDFDNVPKPHGDGPRYAQSRSFEVFNPAERANPMDIYLGLGMTVAGLAGLVLTRRKDISIILAGGFVVSIFMMFGMNNPIIESGPFLSEFVFFERFLITTSLIVALASGLTATCIHSKARELLALRVKRFSRELALIAPLLLALILLLDSQPHYTHLIRQANDEVWILASEAIDENAEPGRIADFIGRPEPAFFPHTVGRDSLTGWYFEGTSNWEQITRLGPAVTAGHYGFANRQLKQWWATGAYSNADNEETARALTALGFSPVDYFDPFQTGLTAWARDERISIISDVQRNAVVVGRAHSGVEVVFPWVNQTELGEYSEISDAEFELNKLIIFAEADPIIPKDFADDLENFRNNGGAVLSILGNNLAVWNDTLSSDHTQFPDTFDIVSSSGEIVATVSGLLDDVEVWGGLYITDERATSLLRAKGPDGFDVPLLTKFEGKSGTVYTLGGAYYAMAFDRPDIASMDVIENALTAEIPDLVTGDGLRPVAASIIEKSSERLSLKVEDPAGTKRALISTTYAPHWKQALVDDSPVDFIEYEGLVMLDLPAGAHTVELVQGIPGSYYRGISLSILLAIAVYLFMWHRDWLRVWLKLLKRIRSERIKQLWTDFVGEE